MGVFAQFPLDTQSAFLYTAGTTSAVALSVMLTRKCNLCSSNVSRKLLHICTQCSVSVTRSDGSRVCSVLASLP